MTNIRYEKDEAKNIKPHISRKCFEKYFENL